MSIRILQFSDIMIGSSEFKNEQHYFLDHLTGAISQNSDGESKVDYLIICGNITKDGETQSFDEARILLQELAQRLLPEKDQQHWWNRIVLVPGRKDVKLDSSEGLQPEAFINFYNSLSTELRGTQQDSLTSRNFNEPIIRPLKDLTIIGFPYWNPMEEERQEPEFDQLQKALIAVNNAIPKYHCCHRTPTLLVTPESPILALSVRSRLHQQPLRQLLEREIRLDLHLFGSAPITCFTVEPFVFRHIGLSTGPRANGNLWPLRVNLVTFSPVDKDSLTTATDPTPQLKTGFFNVRASQRNNSTSDWEHENIISGHLDSLITEDKRIPVVQLSHHPYFNCLKLELDSQSGGIRLAENLPGSYFYEIFDRDKTIKIGDTAIELINYDLLEEKLAQQFELESESEKVIEDIELSIKSLIEKISQKRENLDKILKIKIVVCIHDNAFPKISHNSKRYWLKKIRNLLRPLREKTDLILYSTIPSDSARMLRSTLDCKPWEDNDWVEGSIKEFLLKYLSQVPLSIERLYQIVGTYSEFGKAIVEIFRVDFTKWSGAEIISKFSEIKLLENSFETMESRNLPSSHETRDMRKLVQRFYEAIEPIRGAADVLKFIEERVRKALKDTILGKREISDHIAIDANEISKAMRLDNKDVKEVLEYLSEHSIIDQTDDYEQRYIIKVIAPFIYNFDSLPQTEPTSGSENQAIKVFFAYAPEDEELRDKIAKHLKLLERQKIISAWYDGEISAGTEWEPAIEQHLNSSQVILLLISSDFLASDFCYKVELEKAMERHKTGEARIIPVILRPAADWQDTPFGKLQALPKNAKPITTWSNLDEAFVDIATGIRKVVEELTREKS